MESKKQWLTLLTNFRRPMVPNVAFSFIEMLLAKMVEVEFECPCNPERNKFFSSAFFIIPTVLAFTLMLIIERCRCDAWFRKTVFCFVPAFVWLILMFFDGQYLACAMTTWNGTFVVVDKDAKMKWCKPNVTSDELIVTTESYFWSRVISIVLLILFCVGLIVYIILQSRKPEEETNASGSKKGRTGNRGSSDQKEASELEENAALQDELGRGGLRGTHTACWHGHP
uniref:uncharacterized protein LOC120812692 n=1 Tax=Gasterosteus aculeatus aculeatus TaxID=481459 RepID=UPI001A99C820|nr:uncharacterized protein LOC120812692 [Gasterosteus aculeatus aculeatus]